MLTKVSDDTRQMLFQFRSGEQLGGGRRQYETHDRTTGCAAARQLAAALSACQVPTTAMGESALAAGRH
jgi:hypothetical protein